MSKAVAASFKKIIKTLLTSCCQGDIIVLSLLIQCSVRQSEGRYFVYQIDNQSRRAVYEQIVEQVEKHILTGVLNGGDRMPSVRNLSLELHVNPNTVQRAYTELERGGIISTSPGRGTFVSDRALELLRKLRRESLADLRPLIRELAIAGVEKEALIELVEEIYKGEV